MRTGTPEPCCFTIKSVAKTLAKYNGDYDWEYENENKLFTATVMFSEGK